MELSDPPTPDTSIDLDVTANRRKSGRATQKPVLLNKDPNIPQVSTGSSAKRKRTDPRVEDFSHTSSEEVESISESDPDEEELKERRRKASRPKKARSSQSVSKKTKTAPALTTNLAVRPATNGIKKAAKPKKARARPAKNAANAADDGTGLYC